MPRLSYIYFPDPYENPITKERSAIYRPYILVRLCNGHKISRGLVNCLLDSGSDRNLFPAGWGESVDINIKKGKELSILGIGGIEIKAYRHKVKLYVGDYSFESEVDFSFAQNKPLLGRDGFFNQFEEIVFNQNKKLVLLGY